MIEEKQKKTNLYSNLVGDKTSQTSSVSVSRGFCEIWREKISSRQSQVGFEVFLHFLFWPRRGEWRIGHPREYLDTCVHFFKHMTVELNVHHYYKPTYTFYTFIIPYLLKIHHF